MGDCLGMEIDSLRMSVVVRNWSSSVGRSIGDCFRVSYSLWGRELGVVLVWIGEREIDKKMVRGLIDRLIVCVGNENDEVVWIGGQR